MLGGNKRKAISQEDLRQAFNDIYSWYAENGADYFKGELESSKSEVADSVKSFLAQTGEAGNGAFELLFEKYNGNLFLRDGIKTLKFEQVKQLHA